MLDILDTEEFLNGAKTAIKMFAEIFTKKYFEHKNILDNDFMVITISSLFKPPDAGTSFPSYKLGYEFAIGCCKKIAYDLYDDIGQALLSDIRVKQKQDELANEKVIEEYLCNRIIPVIEAASIYFYNESYDELMRRERYY